ncbi:MAG: twin-arginine translocation signal domain-containing protein, partial [Thermoguttaceae bacterium]|nr:twin-arginine translocation signal domain-containing protein [Thermoguttaceae bacterium]
MERRDFLKALSVLAAGAAAPAWSHAGDVRPGKILYFD